MTRRITLKVGSGQPTDLPEHVLLDGDGLRVVARPDRAAVVLTSGDTEVTIAGVTASTTRRFYGNATLRGVCAELDYLVLHARFRSEHHVRDRLRAVIDALADLPKASLTRAVIAFYADAPTGADHRDWQTLPVQFGKGPLAQYRALAKVAKMGWDAQAAHAFFGAEGRTLDLVGFDLNWTDWVEVAHEGWTFADWAWARQRGLGWNREDITARQVRFLRQRRFTPRVFGNHGRASGDVAKDAFRRVCRTRRKTRHIDLPTPPSALPLDPKVTTHRTVQLVADGFITVFESMPVPFGSRAVAVEILADDGRTLRVTGLPASGDIIFGLSFATSSSMREKHGREWMQWWFDLAWDLAAAERTGWPPQWLNDLYGYYPHRDTIDPQAALRWICARGPGTPQQAASLHGAGWLPSEASSFFPGAVFPEGVDPAKMLRFFRAGHGWHAEMMPYLFSQSMWSRWLSHSEPGVPEYALLAGRVREERPKPPGKKLKADEALHLLVKVGLPLARVVVETGADPEECIEAHQRGELSAEGLHLMVALG